MSKKQQAKSPKKVASKGTWFIAGKVYKNGQELTADEVKLFDQEGGKYASL